MAKPEKPKTNAVNLPPAFGSNSSKIHPANDPDTPPNPNSYSLEKFRLYETRARFYLIGSDRNKKFFRVLKIDRMEPSDLNISEDPVVYPPQEVKSLLQRIAEGNRATGGLSFVAKVYGIVGCIKFLESYYLILVTRRRQIGSICGHAIYSIDESQIITIPHVSVQTDIAHSKTELRYRKLLSSVDLTNDFFFSYTYPIMQSLQKNVLSMGEEWMPYDNMFVWNSFLTQTIRSRCQNTIWTIPLVHGNFKQVRLSIFGRDFSVSLVSRRSRHFAGTRYLKRGVNDNGRVANDVETEQIVLDEEAGSCKGKMSSVVQMRGSIPLFWSQEASRFSPKPDIILQRYDPTYEATKIHFDDLARRYGNPIIVLNLIKTVEKRPREMMLRREFATRLEKQAVVFHPELKKVAIGGFGGTLYKIEFALYILKSALSLEKMHISKCVKEYQGIYKGSGRWVWPRAAEPWSEEDCRKIQRKLQGKAVSRTAQLCIQHDPMRNSNVTYYPSTNCRKTRFCLCP